MKRHIVLWTLLLLAPSLALAQTAGVTRNVNLRPDPSTNNDPIEKLMPGTQIHLLEPVPTGGFFHVQADGQEGWVWGKNIQIQQPQPAGPGGGGTAAGAAPADAISSEWSKPDAQTSSFHSDEGDCGKTGDGGDTDTNRRKNRTDIPDTYHPVTWNAINNTRYPKAAPRSRMDWQPDQLAQIQPFEGAAISVEGFLYKVKVESSSPNAATGGESTNCHARLANDVDWHMPLTASVGENEDVAIIVETTPRVRRQHPHWTTAQLKPWTAHVGSAVNLHYNRQKVRISGWLMLDPEHQDMINNGLRSTLWEIHPITKIEVLSNSQWIDLDSQ
jgi:hypothetical protein